MVNGRVIELDREFRQDLVDNSIYELLHQTIGIEDWDIDIISEVREGIEKVIVKRNLMTSEEFYHFIDDEEFEENLPRIDTLGQFLRQAFLAVTKSFKSVLVFCFGIFLLTLLHFYF